MVERSKKLIGINATCFSDRPSGAKNRFVGFFRNIFNANHDINFVVYMPIDCNLSKHFSNQQNVCFKETPLKSIYPLQRFLFGLFYWFLSLEE